MVYEFLDSEKTFFTDGRCAYINPSYYSVQSAEQKAGLFLHITLHCALNHVSRCGPRILSIWNIAADIVTNCIIVEAGFCPPKDTAEDIQYRDLSVEQVYVKLMQKAKRISKKSGNKNVAKGDKEPDTGKSKENLYAEVMQVFYGHQNDLKVVDETASESRLRMEQNKAYWKNVVRKAKIAERMSQKKQGKYPAGLELEIENSLSPQMDWRILLWRFMVRSPCDYSDFDRRFVYRGLYLDGLESESLFVYIGIDTSGSIDAEQLEKFLAEVRSIKNCYPFIETKIYYVDAEVYGPCEFDFEPIIKTYGGGGTDFRPFFKIIEEQTAFSFDANLCVYLTDGFGDFPCVVPSIPVMWVLSSDGNSDIPFGDVVRLLD